MSCALVSRIRLQLAYYQKISESHYQLGNLASFGHGPPPRPQLFLWRRPTV